MLENEKEQTQQIISEWKQSEVSEQLTNELWNEREKFWKEKLNYET